MSLQKVLARMEERMDEDEVETVDGVRSWRGHTVFEKNGHKLIAGNGFVWDAREEKLHGNPKSVLAEFGGSEDCDEDVLLHYTNIRMAVRQDEDDPNYLTNDQWELTKGDRGYVDVVSTVWNQIIAEVTPWGYVNLYIPKEEFLSLAVNGDAAGEREKLLQQLDELGYAEDEVRRILGV